MIDASQTPPAPLMLHEAYEKLVQACCLYQVMTIVDMVYVVNMPRSLNHVRRMAALLAGNKDREPGHYLYRFPLAQRSGGNGLRVFVPGEASRTLWPQDDRDGFIWNNPSTMERYSYSFVCHNLAVTRLCICAALFCRDNPSYYLVETRLSYDIARKPPRVSLGADGQQTTVSVIPDCWLFIERVADGEGSALWFEVDNSTTYRQTFHRRLSARLELITSGAYAAYFDTAAVLLCFAVLNNEARMHTLAHWTWELLVQQERTQFAPLFRFASVEYETLYQHIDTLFTSALWRLPADRSQDDPALVTLLPSPKTKGESA